MCQTLKTVFDHISKNLQVKNTPPCAATQPSSQINKLTLACHASVLLLMMIFVITFITLTVKVAVIHEAIAEWIHRRTLIRGLTRIEKLLHGKIRIFFLLCFTGCF